MTTLIKPGVELLGEGPPVQRHSHSHVTLRMWLRQGEPVRWLQPSEPSDRASIDETGAALTIDVRVDRSSLIAGLLYGIQGMRVGGTRTLRIAPHLAYGAQGVPGLIPANALLTVEISVLSPRPELDW
jgi:hypothetical protein